MFRSLAGLAAGLLLIGASAGIAAEPVTKDEARATALDLAAKLEQGYMDPAIGKAYAATLRDKAEAGAYDALSDPTEFGDAVTADLQAVNADKHLSLRLQGDNGPRRRAPRPGETAPTMAPPPPGAFIGETKWVGPGVAYVEWYLFPSNEESVAAAKDFLRDYKGANALVIDARRHRGGGLGEMDAIFAHLFGEPTRLVTMKIREGKGDFMVELLEASKYMRPQPKQGDVNAWEHWSIPVESGSPWAEVPVYLLVSSRTGSAAEHLTLSLKTTGRATVIGEATAGAGHFGGVEEIGERFQAFIPVGETVDPQTDKGWEGVGVAPDVAVPAPDALAKALELIKR